MRFALAPLFVVTIALFATQGVARQGDAPPAATLSATDLDNLVAPIALYPDSLLASVLPASTIPLDVVAAARYLRDHGGSVEEPPEDKGWDASVLSLMAFPSVLYKMNDDLDWTQNLGDAVITQQGDVMDAIQRLRETAFESKQLVSDDKQTVIVEKNIITIVPTDPQVVYVPTYQTVYVKDNSSNWLAGAIGFGVGVAVGAAIANDHCDWHYHGIHHGSYHGYWGGSRHGDVNVNVNRNVNINNNNINVNNPRGRDGRNASGGGSWQPSQQSRQRAQERRGGGSSDRARADQARAGLKPAGGGNRTASQRSAGSASDRARGRSERPSSAGRSAFDNKRGAEANRNSQRGSQSRSSSARSGSGSSRSGSGGSAFSGSKGGSRGGSGRGSGGGSRGGGRGGRR